MSLEDAWRNHGKYFSKWYIFENYAFTSKCLASFYRGTVFTNDIGIKFGLSSTNFLMSMNRRS